MCKEKTKVKTEEGEEGGGVRRIDRWMMKKKLEKASCRYIYKLVLDARDKLGYFNRIQMLVFLNRDTLRMIVRRIAAPCRTNRLLETRRHAQCQGIDCSINNMLNKDQTYRNSNSTGMHEADAGCIF